MQARRKQDKVTVKYLILRGFQRSDTAIGSVGKVASEGNAVSASRVEKLQMPGEANTRKQLPLLCEN